MIVSQVSVILKLKQERTSVKRAVILNSILICLMPSFAAADDKENDLYISFGEEFIIKKDQSANIKESHASIYIKDFFMMSCAVPDLIAAQHTSLPESFMNCG